MKKQLRRVVVTGMGAVTPFGAGVPSFAEALRAGQSGIRLLTQIDTAGVRTKGGGEVLGMLPAVEGLSTTVHRFVKFAAVAWQEAWRQSGVAGHVDPTRLGVLMGTSRGAIRELEIAQALLTKRNPAACGFLFPAVQANEQANTGERLHIKNVAAALTPYQTDDLPALMQLLFPQFGSSVLGRSLAALSSAEGPVGTISAACTSGTISIGEGATWIAEGRCDAVIVGGAESPFTPVSFAGVCSSGAMSTRWDEPSLACRPFDRTRDGYVMGEGAGVLVLEAEEQARARGAQILAFVRGYAQTDDASHITVPTGEGLARAITLALEQAELTAPDLDYINAHGTATELNDRFETWAVKKVLGPHADLVPLSSTKSMTGHLLGAAGAIEAIATILALQQGFLPPTIHLQERDPHCDLDYVPNSARVAKVRTAMSQSLGFGGHNAALILSGSL